MAFTTPMIFTVGEKQPGKHCVTFFFVREVDWYKFLGGKKLDRIFFPNSNGQEFQKIPGPPQQVAVQKKWAYIGILGIINHEYPLYRVYIGISHRGTLVGVHPTIP